MSQTPRPQAQGPAKRRKREMKLDAVYPLEERCLLAPYLTVAPTLAAFRADATQVTGTTTGEVDVTLNQASTSFLSAAPLDTVSQLTPISSFGGDIVRIRSGPGGVFGSGLYAISRGAGENATNGNDAVNRPGVIYRVDPATGKTSVFFDLNSVASQLETGATAANSVGASTGLVNWYDIAFDPEGTFDGRPSMFVSSVDRSDPTKNVVYRIAPDGTFMGAFVSFTDGESSLKFNVNPTAILVPPPEDESFLKGLIAGSGIATSTGGNLSALYFDANAFSPGQNISSSTLPTGVSTTGLTDGNISGLTAANFDYLSPVYSSYTDFGTPAATEQGIPGTPGLSGVQGINGEELITNNSTTAVALSSTDSTITDRISQVSSPFRRFEDIAFDQYSYFAQGVNIGGGTGTTTTTSSTGTGSVGGTGAGGGSGTGVGLTLAVGSAPGLIDAGLSSSTSTTSTSTGTTGTTIAASSLTLTIPPANAGNVFVADLATGLSVPVLIPQSNPATYVRVPVQGPESVSVDATGAVTITSDGDDLGGRIVRITPTGIVSTFAQGFATSNAIDANGFTMSSLSLSFSADGTTLYVADDDGVWQFKTTASLAGSDSGSLVGLNDLRSLGVPYNGQNSAVAVIDTGVDATSTPFRGRVAAGTNVYTNGFGNVDTASISTGSTTGGGGGTGGTAGGTGGTGTTGGSTTSPVSPDGHGTLVAGVIAQFVPQATILPINIFAPFFSTSLTQGSSGGTGSTGGTTGGTSGGTSGSTQSGSSNALTTSNTIYQALGYVTKHPFVNDPIRPGQTDRVIATTLAFGTTETFNSEGVAYRRYPQIVIAFKNQLKKFRSLGIAPIAAAGQFGAPLGAGSSTNTGSTGTTGGTGTTTTTVNGDNNAQNSSVGDSNGMTLPAIFNEVVSVSGSYSFPFATGPGNTPNDPSPGVFGTYQGPVLLLGSPQTVAVSSGGSSGSSGGTSGSGSTGGFGGIGGSASGTGGTAGSSSSVVATLTNADAGTTIYSDRILGSVNRSITTDYVAPALDVPTFRRNISNATAAASNSAAGSSGSSGTAGGTSGTSTSTTSAAVNTADALAFADGGTSLSAAIVTGAFALVSSALDYWTALNVTGVTSDAYLTQPVGATTLNYGPNAFKDLSAYNNPDGINAILQWTAVPINDPNNGLSASTPTMALGSTNYKNYSRISVSNAIAAIEGEIALQWLIGHNDLKLIDGNNDGIITTEELQTFVDNSAKTGNPEAGAMARLLGGTARPAAVAGSTSDVLIPGLLDSTSFGDQEDPNQPDVLQRRFNFFDYAADGTLNGSVTIAQLNLLAHNLLPSPDSFVIVDRQRASANGYLINPTAARNYTDLQHISPKYEWVPKSALTKYRNISPAQFKVDKGTTPGSTFPLYTLYDGAVTHKGTIVTNLPDNTVSAIATGKTTASTTTSTSPTQLTSTSISTPSTTTPTALATSTTIAASGSTTSTTGTGTVAQAQAAGIPIPSTTTSSSTTPSTTTAKSVTTATTIPIASLALTTTTPTSTSTATPIKATPVVTSSPAAPATVNKLAVVKSTKSKGFFNGVSSSLKKIFG